MISRLILVLVMVVFIRVPLLMAEELNPYGLPWCVDRRPSANIKQIECLKSYQPCSESLNESQAVRDGFKKILERKKNCSRCRPLVVNEDKYVSLYHLPFLVIAHTIPTRGSVSGFDLHIVFKNGPKQEFELGMSCLNDGSYEIDGIIDIDPSKKMSKLIKKLGQKEFAQYWIDR